MKNRFEPKFNITNRITAGLTRIERARGFLEAAALSEAWVREMGRRALILEAHHTTHIEGTRLTTGSRGPPPNAFDQPSVDFSDKTLSNRAANLQVFGDEIKSSSIVQKLSGIVGIGLGNRFPLHPRRMTFPS